MWARLRKTCYVSSGTLNPTHSLTKCGREAHNRDDGITNEKS